MPDVKVTYDVMMLSAEALVWSDTRKQGRKSVEKPNPPSAQVTRWSAQTRHRNKPAATQLARPPKPQHKPAGRIIKRPCCLQRARVLKALQPSLDCALSPWYELKIWEEKQLWMVVGWKVLTLCLAALVSKERVTLRVSAQIRKYFTGFGDGYCCPFKQLLLRKSNFHMPPVEEMYECFLSKNVTELQL